MSRYCIKMTETNPVGYIVWDKYLGVQCGNTTFNHPNLAKNLMSFKNSEHDHSNLVFCGLSDCNHFQIKHKRNKNPDIHYFEVNIFHPNKREWMTFINSPDLAQQMLNNLHEVYIN